MELMKSKKADRLREEISRILGDSKYSMFYTSEAVDRIIKLLEKERC